MKAGRTLPYALFSPLLGVLHTASFAPLHAWWLQVLTLGGLYWLLQQPSRTLKSALCIGFAFGLGWFLSGTSWIYISLHDYGGLPVWLAGLATFLFCSVLALLPATACLLFQRLRPPIPRWFSPLLFAACWALSEWLRGTVFTGFPWISTGSAHTLGPLRGYAAAVGVYGVGFVAALCAALCAHALLRSQRAGAACMAVVLMLLAGAAALDFVPFTQATGKPISVRLLQGNIPQDMKFDLQHFRASFHTYGQLVSQQRADLIALPETALPQLWQEIDADYLRGLRQFSSSTDSSLIIGVPINDGPGRYTNSAVQIAPVAIATYPAPLVRYDKSHLVPFGEFIPFGFRWFTDLMNIPLGDFTRGSTRQAPFEIAGQRIAVNICYEDLFGEEIIRSLQGERPATILLNLSNIAWFGDSIALPQHLQASQMRALESGRPMLRATNTGTTAVIDPHGTVTATLAPFTQGSLNASVQGYAGLTPYARWGNVPVLILIGLVLLASLLKQRQRRN
ncbi:MAG: apolipoprotein N-acyltransferase [Burkholderiaceae bacterium]|nr:MAG: apolipoprotein N-acyltransferase [Burkholderiaceae bacterium]